MKLFEKISTEGISISQAIKDMVQDMFNQEIDDETAAGMAEKLSLSDIIALDSSYTNWQKDEVLDIIGPIPQMEYNMGPGSQATSSASSRPAARTAAAPQAKKQNTTTQSSSNYSGGVQNGVSTTNIDNEDDPDAMPQDGERASCGSLARFGQANK